MCRCLGHSRSPWTAWCLCCDRLSQGVMSSIVFSFHSRERLRTQALQQALDMCPCCRDLRLRRVFRLFLLRSSLNPAPAGPRERCHSTVSAVIPECRASLFILIFGLGITWALGTRGVQQRSFAYDISEIGFKLRPQADLSFTPGC